LQNVLTTTGPIVWTYCFQQETTEMIKLLSSSKGQLMLTF